MEPDDIKVHVPSTEYVPVHKAPSELLQDVRVCVQELRKYGQNPIKGLSQLSKLRDLYYDKKPRHYRREIGDVLAECGFSTCARDMLETQYLNGYFSEGLDKLINLNLWKTTRFLLDNIWNYSDESPDFAQELGKSNILELLCSNLTKFKNRNYEKTSKQYWLTKATLCIMNNIARRPENKQFFEPTKAKNLVYEFQFSHDNFLKVLSLTTLAFIINASESLRLTEDTDTIQVIIHWMNLAIEKDEFNRLKEGFSAAELAYALDKLAIDGNTQRIIEGHALKSLHRMLNSADVTMQINAAKCIWTLSFNPDARKEIKHFKKLWSTLQRMQTEKLETDLAENINGAMWVLTEKGDAKPTPVDPSKPQHLFISYCHKEKETVRKIWQKLREAGYDVWIDIERMSGNLLDAMSSAVESASMVIVCVSEGYKQSQCCRTEAGYSYDKKKQFIPLKMQDPYSPDGWLGAMISSTLYFNFSSNVDFDDSFGKLVREIERKGVELPMTPSLETQIVPKYDNKTTTVTPPSDLTIAKTTNSSVSRQAGSIVQRSPQLNLQALEINSPTSSIASSVVTRSFSSSSVSSSGGPPERIARMTKNDVREWLKENDLETSIPDLKRVTGKLLWQLKCMKVESPDFYNNFLKDELKLSGIDLLSFRSALDELE